ncbi:CKLF-like MARVEL transmembrane domain-containing protein 8 [Homalodisca vitripennis]|uniref:CKLF-like MARVEL transmembrane domain-containing protein 8 n=1 Tax=Homalodisca vitripennis TaxID=197043 RepID=UPI001EEBF3C5|nr:CKLF-like MARVEL transmembrane domain-containing protein 8 [Homalodisca vitripennis]
MPETVVNVTPSEGKPESTTDSLFSWININYAYFRTLPGMLKIAEAVLGVVCLALATPAILAGTSWFLFVVVLSFVATLIWIAIYLIGVREALTLPINWILTELLNTGLVTILYAVAFIVQLSVWSTPYSSSYRSSNIAAGVFGLINTVVYAAACFLLYRDWRATFTQ